MADDELLTDMESLVQAAWTLFLRYAQHHGNCPRRGSNAADCLCGLSTVNQTVMGMAKKYAPAPPSRPPMGNDYRVRNKYRGHRSDD